MAKVTSKVRSENARSTEINVAAAAFVQSQIVEGLGVSGVQDHPVGAVIAFDADDCKILKAIKDGKSDAGVTAITMQPAHEAAKAATAADPSNVWKVVENAADSVSFTDRTKRSVKDAEGKQVVDENGKSVPRKSQPIKINGLERSSLTHVQVTERKEKAKAAQQEKAKVAKIEKDAAKRQKAIEETA